MTGTAIGFGFGGGSSFRPSVAAVASSLPPATYYDARAHAHESVIGGASHGVNKELVEHFVSGAPRGNLRLREEALDGRTWPTRTDEGVRRADSGPKIKKTICRRIGSVHWRRRAAVVVQVQL